MTTFLRKLRQKNNITQEYLAKKMDVSRPTYIQIENKSREMTVAEAKKLANIFGMELDDFINERELAEPKLDIIESQKLPKPQKTELRISVPQENIAKFKEVLLYVLSQIGALSNIGEAVICKLLYFIDFDYYELYEEQLMGAVYIRNHHGPTPAAFMDIVKDMEKNGDLVQVEKKYFQYKQKKYLPLRKVDLSGFSAQEINLIDSEIERFKNYNAKKMEEYSHQDVPWLSTEDLHPIDYEAVFYRTPEYSARQYD